jgi:hypothetical protein
LFDQKTFKLVQNAAGKRAGIPLQNSHYRPISYLQNSGRKNQQDSP